MAEFFLGQVMMTGFPFAIKSFALANGQIMGISQNQALFSLLGVQYGGDGIRTFALPNLQGRAAVGAGGSRDPSWNPPPYDQGTAEGVETVAVTAEETPPHLHMVQATTTTGTLRASAGAALAASSVTTEFPYGPLGGVVPLSSATIGQSAGGGAHTNMQPFGVLNFQIALAGIFPSRN